MKPPRLSRRLSIHTLLLGILTFLSFLAILGNVASSIYTTNNIGDVTQEQSAEIIKERLLSSLVSINRGIALDVGRSLEKTAEMATILAEYTLDAWTSPDRVSMGWAEEETLTRGDQGQWTNGKEDTSSLFIPNFVSITPQVLAEVEKSRRLDLVFESIQKSNPEIAAIYFTSKNEVTRYYPNIGLGGVIPPNFKATQRPWYLAAIQTSIPRSEVVWTTSLDTTGLGMVGTVSKAIYDRGSLIGVVGIDVLVEDILANVEKPLELRGGYNFLIDYQGYALVLPEQAYLDILERQPAEGEFLTNLRDARNEFLTTISEMRKGNSGVQEIDLGERTLLVAYQPVAYADWSLASVVDAAYYLAPITGLQRELRSTTQRFIVTQVLPLSAAVFTLIVFIGLVLSNLITVPVRQLALAAEKLGRNEWNVDIPEDAPGEIGLFARTFRNMADHLKDLISNLEQKVAERTEALHRRATQLQASIEVGRAVASERNLEKLLSMVTHLISERFGFYHVGVFLIDAKGEYAWLKAANSEGGQRMLQRQHRLKVNEQGIVGYVTGTGKARIALDVGEDAVFFNNPDLPFTRSEMALPLIAQGRILGALDIQSEKGGAFTEEDIEVLSGMANLVAIAIQNAELFAETQAALEATRRAYQEMSLKGWIDLIRRTPYPTYLSTHLKKVTRLPRSSSPLVERVLQTNDIQRGDEHEIALPIFVKGNRIGVLRLRRHVHQPPFSDTDIDLFQDIALRIGTALEAARLYQESQKRALREKLVGEITSKIRSSNEPTEILRIAVQELQKALQATKAQVTFFPPKSAKGENGHHEGVE